MKKINIEKLFKKLKTRKKEEILVEGINKFTGHENLQLPMNPWLDEIFPRIQRK